MMMIIIMTPATGGEVVWLGKMTKAVVLQPNIIIIVIIVVVIIVIIIIIIVIATKCYYYHNIIIVIATNCSSEIMKNIIRVLSCVSSEFTCTTYYHYSP